METMNVWFHEILVLLKSLAEGTVGAHILFVPLSWNSTGVTLYPWGVSADLKN